MSDAQHDENGPRPWRAWALSCCLIGFSLAICGPSLPTAVSAQGDRAAAAEAYDRGTSAYLSGEFSAAADWFETAHRLSPAARALMDAIRAHLRADTAEHRLRAANLALRLRALYPDDAQARRVAEDRMSHAERHYVHLTTSCDQSCSIDLNGMLLEHPEIFVEPDTDTEIAAIFETGSVTRHVQGVAGEDVVVSFEAPPPPIDPPEVEPPPETARTPRVPRWATFSAFGATAALGAVTLWSGIDTLSGVDAYEDMPTRERLRDGQARERRTNALIGATAGVATASILLALFTNWRSVETESESPPLTPSLTVVPSSEPTFGAGLQGAF